MSEEEEVTCLARHKMREDDRTIITANEVALTATRRQIRKFFLEPASFIDAETREEEVEEFFLFETGSEVLDLRVVEKELERKKN